MKLIKPIALLTAMGITLAATAADSAHTPPKEVNLKIVETSDVHGNFFPYNFITRTEWDGSMARIATLVDSLRASDGDESIILLDNGDILQGQPTVYYYNFVDTASRHIASEIYDFMAYDAATIGNHDVETGHNVYDRWIRDTNVPVLGANVIDISTGSPYLKPYTVIERQGLKIAVIGMLTPGIPMWLPEPLWSGLRFDDITTSARKWIDIVRQRENPDIIVGLFHSGHSDTNPRPGITENACLDVARNVAGFDIILGGHDHQRDNRVVMNPDGKPVVILNPANDAKTVGVVSIAVNLDENGKMTGKKVSGTLVDVDSLTPSQRFLDRFDANRQAVEDFTGRIIGRSEGTFDSSESLFGPSAFMTLIHRLQLQLTGADISFAAPLSIDAVIHPGEIRVSDMFGLYKYENMLLTMSLTGEEIRNYLEESYSIWVDTAATRPDGHLLLFRARRPSVHDNRLRNPAYNFDSAAGIKYTVDITRPKGQRVNIMSMADGTPFDLKKTYTVAVNSYRGNGGGDLMTRGAGLSKEELKRRTLSSTDADLRYYMMKEIEKRGVIKPETDRNWRFVPENLADRLAARDRKIIKGKQNR